jgi:hypothetical protein
MLAEFQKKKPAALYSMYDANSNRVIELADFHLLPDRFSNVCNWKPSKPEYDAQLLQQLFYNQDPDSPGNFSLDRILESCGTSFGHLDALSSLCKSISLMNILKIKKLSSYLLHLKYLIKNFLSHLLLSHQFYFGQVCYPICPR